MTLPPNITWAQIRRLAQWSATAYDAPNILDAGTNAAALVQAILPPDGGPVQIVVAFKGSKSAKDFIQDAEFWFADVAIGDVMVSVHHGFLADYTAIKAKVRAAVAALLQQYPEARIYITGHSLGGGQAVLCAQDFAAQGLPVALVVTFGQPRVGSGLFCDAYDKEAVGVSLPQPTAHSPQPSRLRDITYRVVNQNDIVPRTPGVLIGYRHGGQEIFLTAAGGWALNPSEALKALSDASGFWTAFRKGTDVLVSEHFIAAYQSQIAQFT